MIAIYKKLIDFTKEFDNIQYTTTGRWNTRMTKAWKRERSNTAEVAREKTNS